ncbi:hypothetical protein FNJ88_10990 [Chryseobacterium sp. SNU WT5]|uniref:hypothetical protein n=1 Tax=Chryseobacterium sp. SNU WT5 TaxID=2594269 RepID=UPI0011803432|nr:hypothetical protein [Chryseobacterium sp. SNU WT5]QDP86044.1 hypothetical protein FNJ88_10990 [Chryseobacterium sp. SNU WT5]
MKNADKPINPMSASFAGADNELKIEYQNDNFSQQMGGLTKREYFAGLAMQGLINNVNSPTFIAQKAVELADKLLQKLEYK